MDRQFIIIIIVLLMSCSLIGIGITYCTKVDKCYRPFEDNQCLGMTEDCPYNNFQGISRGNCCLNETNSECMCCKFYNGYTDISICVPCTCTGGFLLFGTLCYTSLLYSEKKDNI